MNKQQLIEKIAGEAKYFQSPGRKYFEHHG